jgi:hypothetical protein
VREHKHYPIGTRLEMIFMPDDPDPIPTGARGTVIGGDERVDQVGLSRGTTVDPLNLIPSRDRFRVIQ